MGIAIGANSPLRLVSVTYQGQDFVGAYTIGTGLSEEAPHAALTLCCLVCSRLPTPCVPAKGCIMLAKLWPTRLRRAGGKGQAHTIVC